MALNVLILISSLLSLFLIGNNISDGMEELKQWNQAVKQVERVKVRAEKSCAAQFDFSFDRDSFALGTELRELESKAMNNYCGDAFAALTDICTYTDYYTTISNVDSVSCVFDKDIAIPSTTLEEGQLRFAFNWDTSDHKITVKDYLIKNL